VTRRAIIRAKERQLATDVRNVIRDANQAAVCSIGGDLSVSQVEVFRDDRIVGPGALHHHKNEMLATNRLDKRAGINTPSQASDLGSGRPFDPRANGSRVPLPLSVL
jgi:hypothetical protein